MSGFKAKMHQIRFPLGLRPRLHWGSLQRSPELYLTGLLLRRERGKGGGGERGREGKVNESEGETKWREGFGPPTNFGVAPPMSGIMNKVKVKGKGEHFYSAPK